MNTRVFVLGLASTLCLYGQMYGGKKKGFDFQDACFKNNALPFCPMRDFVIKPAPKGGPKSAYRGGALLTPVSSPLDAAGIDWRFADPDADTIAVLDCSKLSATSFIHSLIGQLAANQNLAPAQAENMFRALSGVKHVALSVKDDMTLVLVTGRPPDAVLPALESGWKASTVDGNVLLMGNAAAIDQASLRLVVNYGLGELPLAAQQRPTDSEFWMVGSARMAGQAAVDAGVERFELKASMRDGLASDTAFRFEKAPDPSAIQAWLSTLGDARIEGDVVHLGMSMDADQTRQNVSQIALSPLGHHMGAIVNAARYVPVRDTASTVHTKPVIYGLAGGPKEVK